MKIAIILGIRLRIIKLAQKLWSLKCRILSICMNLGHYNSYKIDMIFQTAETSEWKNSIMTENLVSRVKIRKISAKIGELFWENVENLHSQTINNYSFHIFIGWYIFHLIFKNLESKNDLSHWSILKVKKTG